MKNNMILCLLIAVSVFIFGPKVLAACPGCSTIMDDSAASAFNGSVLFLMAMPFLVAGAIVIGYFVISKSAFFSASQVPQEQSQL